MNSWKGWPSSSFEPPRERRHVRIEEFVARAIAALDAALANIPNSNILLERWRRRWERLRLRQLRRVDEEQAEDEQLERELWEQIT
ncbi:hypothetical protein N7519_001541 [Penicillium mononematosum]|uniref:uncharacterized protein n=1 Tax=Penicillium mononematosum TaxID=268346 RepID=UPI002546F95C|nr:uncharacterized protein N7519_001541 [Penicillium mononematosum]KAJ6191520.1 hypothetical protein N7519_001541 [Penicillium mononematosum]